MKILIADDELDLREYLKLLLTRFGHDVRVAADGKEAVKIADSFTPDLLVADWNMPEMDGGKVAEQVKCKTILVSANPKVELARNANVLGFLAKPIRAHELLWLVKNASEANACERSTVSRT